MAMSINEIEIPKYSLGEELWNSISHGAGAIFGIVGLMLMIAKVVPAGDPFAIISAIIYGLALIILFTVSCVYHALGKNNGKRVMRVMDHNMIYILIAGSYTPYTLVAMRSHNIWGWGNGTVAYVMLAIVWISCIVGVVFNSINIKKYAWLSMICYLGAGWVIISAFLPLWDIIGKTACLLLLSSGLCYTVGSILYGLGKKMKYMHTIFHFFVLAGAILMFISIYCFVL